MKNKKIWIIVIITIIVLSILIYIYTRPSAHVTKGATPPKTIKNVIGSIFSSGTSANNTAPATVPYKVGDPINHDTLNFGDLLWVYSDPIPVMSVADSPSTILDLQNKGAYLGTFSKLVGDSIEILRSEPCTDPSGAATSCFKVRYIPADSSVYGNY